MQLVAGLDHTFTQQILQAGAVRYVCLALTVLQHHIRCWSCTNVQDAETYKNSTRSFIRDWLSLLSARRNAQAPLIVLINPYSSAAASSGKTVFGRDKGVLGKLKADFNNAKRDR